VPADEDERTADNRKGGDMKKVKYTKPMVVKGSSVHPC
jgi:hypothetical protein